MIKLGKENAQEVLFKRSQLLEGRFGNKKLAWFSSKSLSLVATIFKAEDQSSFSNLVAYFLISRSGLSLICVLCMINFL